MDNSAIPIQTAKNPGSILDPNVLIEMNEQITKSVAEIVNGVLTLYFFCEKRKTAEKNNTKLQIAPIKRT